MRRHALSVFAACGLAFLSACNSSSGLQTGTGSSISSVVFTNGSAQTNDFFVALSGTNPLFPAAVQVNAEGVTGSGVFTEVVYDATFTWSAAFAPADTPYISGSSPNGTKKCGAPSQTPAIPILYQAPGSLAKVPLPATQATNVVYAAAVPKVSPVEGDTSYCYFLVARQVGGGVQGSVLIVVSNSP